MIGPQIKKMASSPRGEILQRVGIEQQHQRAESEQPDHQRVEWGG